ncbi:baseplate assembly protein [Clostridium tyrobutyricum]|uniref:baseplate assembly protein n=1 Tax=Clostridium tyrobutyricum TaxID=1519 RepID=UPI00057F7485|nr:baseplate J/gp47 family protein [Clostridium tyrobutyricum]
MSDINFVETDSKTIYENIINDFENAYGETLYPADERRIFIQQLISIIVGLKNDINDSARQNLLRYARSPVLDAIGVDIYHTERLEPQKATCPGLITLVAIQNDDIQIPSGKRVTPDGIIFFKIKDDVTIEAGQTRKECILEAVDPGASYNGFLSGQIKNIVDPIPYVESIINTDTSKGGADLEEDDSYRERCRIAPESYSTAGPEKAYEYFAKSADSSIVDVKVDSPSPGVVKIIPLLVNGEIPNQSILDKVYAECTPRNRRPLTDNVQVDVPTTINYDINLTYYLDIEHKTEELQFRKSIEGSNLDYVDGAIRDYINWQQGRMGISINPDELRYKIQNAASYKTSNGKSYTAVRRIVLNYPSFTQINKTDVAKVSNINITYGGME